MRRGLATLSVSSSPSPFSTEPIRTGHLCQVPDHCVCLFPVPGTRVLATGGASSNKDILQVRTPLFRHTSKGSSFPAGDAVSCRHGSHLLAVDKSGARKTYSA